MKHIDFLFHKIYQKNYVLPPWLVLESTSQSTGSSSRWELLSLDKHCVKIRKLGTAKPTEKWAIGPEDVTHWAGSGFFLLDGSAPRKKVKCMDMCIPVFPFQSTTRSSSVGSRTTEWFCSLHLLTLLLPQTDLPWSFRFAHLTCPAPRNSREANGQTSVFPNMGVTLAFITIPAGPLEDL